MYHLVCLPPTYLNPTPTEDGAPAPGHPTRFGAHTRHVPGPRAQLGRAGGEASSIRVSVTLADVPPGVLDGGVPVHVGQQAQAEAAPAVGRVGEPVDEHAARGGLEGLPDAAVQLVVGHRAPMLRLLVADWPEVWKEGTEGGQPAPGRAVSQFRFPQEMLEIWIPA